MYSTLNISGVLSNIHVPQILHRMLVGFGDGDGEEQPDSAEGGEAESKDNDSGADPDDSSGSDDGKETQGNGIILYYTPLHTSPLSHAYIIMAAVAVETKVEDDEQSINTRISSLSELKADKSCLRGFLPQLISTTNLGREIKNMFSDAKNALLGLQGAIRVTRKQRELLVKSQREWEKGCIHLSLLVKEAISSWPIHASAFYDCLRVFPIDMCGLGVGTADVGVHLTFQGLSFSSLNLPKADGSPCPSRKIFIDKIYRALQRKAAAMAAIERQRERARLAKEKAEREAREELERQRRSMDPQACVLCYIFIFSLSARMVESNLFNKI